MRAEFYEICMHWRAIPCIRTSIALVERIPDIPSAQIWPVVRTSMPPPTSTRSRGRGRDGGAGSRSGSRSSGGRGRSSSKAKAIEDGSIAPASAPEQEHDGESAPETEAGEAAVNDDANSSNAGETDTDVQGVKLKTTHHVVFEPCRAPIPSGC